MYRSSWPLSPLHATADGHSIDVIDQTQLPHSLTWLSLESRDQIAHAIRTMVVRGAPLIGACAAWGMAFAMAENAGDAHLDESLAVLAGTRPTAVNLGWALQRMERTLRPAAAAHRHPLALAEARAIGAEDVAQNARLGEHGLTLLRALHARLQRPLQVLTHCNAGWLATLGWGTALAPVYLAQQAGIPVHVWVDETRPRNQGALTAWELRQAGVAHTFIPDNAGGHLMQHQQVDIVLVGADRVSAAGDVCNKIGTYLKALAAFDAGVPFYAAVPTPTIDWTIIDALREIPIEARSADEVAWVSGLDDQQVLRRVQIAPAGTAFGNPAFDVTPARLLSGIITEHGVIEPNAAGLAALRIRLEAQRAPSVG